MDAESLALIAGALLSLIFSYVPGVRVWFAGLVGDYKRLIMLGLLLLTAGAVMGLACAGWAADFGLVITCDRAGLVMLIKAFILAAVANQAAYQVSPQTDEVKRIKALR